MQTIILLMACMIPTAFVGLVAGPTILSWMGAEGDLLRDAVIFANYTFWGIVFMEMVPCLDNVARAAGRPEYTLLANVANVIVLALVEPALVLGIGPIAPMGVHGAGWAAPVRHRGGERHRRPGPRSTPEDAPASSVQIWIARFSAPR